MGGRSARRLSYRSGVPLAPSVKSTPYRDPLPGLQARLTQLRAAWAEAAADVGSGELGVIRDRAGRIGAGKAAVLLQVVGSLPLFARLGSVAQPARHAEPDETRCGNLGLALLLYAVFLLVLVMPVLAVLVRRLTGWWGKRVGARAAHRVLRDPIGAGTDAARALEVLANQTPARAVRARSERLERRSAAWALAGSGVPVYFIAVAGLPMSAGDPAPFAAIVLVLIVQIALAAYASACVDGVDVRSWPIGPALIAGVVLLPLLVAFRHFWTGVVLALQLGYMLHRLARVRRAIAAERLVIDPKVRVSP